jgi:thiamine pyrophosphokinase
VEGVLRAVIFANGGLTHPYPLLPDDLIIAADGGARYCLELGLTPHLVVGDFDSLDPVSLQLLAQAGVELVRYPERKDFTDLELALQHARQRGADEILVLAALGGRWDQTLANLLLPASESLYSTHVTLIDGAQEIHLLRLGERLELHGRPGDTVSLIPLTGDAAGVTTHGLEYALSEETLYFGSTRGISNVLVDESAWVSLQEGLLLCVVIHT